jgi:hypothetical protein
MMFAAEVRFGVLLFDKLTDQPRNDVLGLL